MTSRTVAERLRSHQTLLPITLNLNLASDFDFSTVDSSPAWTTAGTKLTLIQFTSAGNGLLFDYRDEVSIAAGVVTLPGGLWRARFYPTIEKTGAAAETVNLAIANSDGTTIYRETGDIVSTTSNPWRAVQHVETFLEVPEDGGTYTFRGRGVSAANCAIATSVSRPLGQLVRVAAVGYDKE